MSKMWHKLIIFCLLLVSVGCDTIKSESPILYETITTSRQTYVCNKPALRGAQRIETLKEGERIVVLQEPKNRWLQVRTPSGTIGWVESRDVLKRANFDEWQKLIKQMETLVPQMKGETAEEANLRLQPGRETIKVHKIVGSKIVDIFAMAYTSKPDSGSGNNPSAAVTSLQNTAKTTKQPNPKSGKRSRSSGPKYDTWYLIRTQEGMGGWVHASLVNIVVPEELARYAENKTIIAWRILTVSRDDQGQEHPWYLSIEREESTNVDFDRVRILYWNLNRKRYELAYRLQNIIGTFPIEATRIDPGQDGQPSFKIRRLNPDNPNEIIVDEYQMNGTQTKQIASNREGVQPIVTGQ
ncbi:MAG: SH3 domain-containing protein [Acidobacteriota bacterium]